MQATAVSVGSFHWPVLVTAYLCYVHSVGVMRYRHLRDKFASNKPILNASIICLLSSLTSKQSCCCEWVCLFIKCISIRKIANTLWVWGWSLGVGGG